jgi:hypothetical protein
MQLVAKLIAFLTFSGLSTPLRTTFTSYGAMMGKNNTGIYIVTDLMNALPGNSSVNMVQHATIDEAVFSMSSVPSSGGTMALCNPFLSNGLVNTFLHIGPCYESGDVINNRDGAFRGVCAVLIREGRDRIRSGQLRVSRKLEE